NYRGPLHGMPFGLKDIYATSGIRTTSHSKICENLVPTEDATTIAKLYQAGGVLLGKLATHEFAHGGPSFDLPWPPARNPWNRDHFTGGSSSGAGRRIPDYRAALTGDIRGLRIGMIRHFYEDDITVTPEVRAALEEAYGVFRSLGATLEDVRIRPAADYYAVKITIAESEQYAI